MPHEEYADEIKRRIAQLQRPVDGIADIATDVTRINVDQGDMPVDFTPAMMSPTRQG